MNPPIGALRRTLLLASLVIVAGACGSTTATAAPTTTVPTPTAEAGGACKPTDLALTGGAWGSAAGSRGTDVSVENRGSTACMLPAGPAVAVLDAAGTVLLESAPLADTGAPVLEPGGVATFTILFSNWCQEGTALPLHLVLRAGTDTIAIPGLDMTGEDLPPCNGPGQPPALSANPWEPVSD
jgi:Domain of unknown function (DUF4232)